MAYDQRCMIMILESTPNTGSYLESIWYSYSLRQSLQQGYHEGFHEGLLRFTALLATWASM